jgi:hypothetical protein
MSDTMPSLHTTRDTAERLQQLALKSTLNAGDKQACLHAAETLAALADMCTRLEAAEAFLNDEARRLETTLAALNRRRPRRLTTVDATELVDHVRRLRGELEQALPSEPRSVAFGVSPG